MTKSPLDIEIENLATRLERLSDRSLAAFFACCAERLFPLYDSFSKNAGWKKSTEVRALLDRVWQAIVTPAIPEWGDAMMGRIAEDYIPHIDDFDTLEATFAQDTMICLDAAIRALSERSQCDPRWVEYAFEGLKMAICNKLTGYLDVGSAFEEKKFQDKLIHHEWVVKEFSSQNEDLSEIEGQVYLSEENVSKLKNRAIANAWEPSVVTN